MDALKVAGISDPTGFWDGAEIDFPVSIGSYEFAQEPSDDELNPDVGNPGLGMEHALLTCKKQEAEGEGGQNACVHRIRVQVTGKP